MTATTTERTLLQCGESAAPYLVPGEFDVAASTKIVGGTIVCVDASGNATPAVTASSAVSALRVVGIAENTVDNTAGSAGDLKIRVRTGIQRFINGDAITKSSINDLAFAGDNQTVYKSSASGTRPRCGVIRNVDANYVYVQVMPGLTQTYNMNNTVFAEQYVKAAESAAGDTTAETAIIRLQQACTISSIKITPTGAATASDTLYATITIAKRDGAGGAASTIVAPTTKLSGSGGTGNWVAFTTLDAGTLANTYCVAGSVLTITVAKASTGTQLPSYVVSINYALAI